MPRHPGPQPSPGRIGDHAVVLGASMAGLLAARVLTDAYAQVTIIDRDQLPHTSNNRRGVPHGRHAHALLARGQQAHVRASVRALPNLTILDRCQVIGLATTADGHRVTGARAPRRADGSAGAEEVLGADLVIDATGRGSRTPTWLEALGYPRPPTEQVRIGLGYATRTYRLPPDALGNDLGVLHGTTPEHPRGGALLLVEGHRWMVTLAGMLGDYPPTAPDGFLAFARSLRFPDIYQAIRDGEPLDDPVGFRFPASVRHRYERLPRFPDGLLVVGDAVCSFNPIYGQGMSVAALEALALRRLLRRGTQPQPHRFFRDLARVVDVPWDIAVGGDLVFPEVQGRRPLKVRLGNAYIVRLHAAAAHDAGLASAFMRVAGLVAPPQSLLRPSIVLGVLRARPRPGGVARGRLRHREAVPAATTPADSGEVRTVKDAKAPLDGRSLRSQSHDTGGGPPILGSNGPCPAAALMTSSAGQPADTRPARPNWQKTGGCAGRDDRTDATKGAMRRRHATRPIDGATRPDEPPLRRLTTTRDGTPVAARHLSPTRPPATRTASRRSGRASGRARRPLRRRWPSSRGRPTGRTRSP